MTAPTPEQRQQWRALADGATEGPWEAARDRDNWIVGDLWNGLNGMVGGFAAGGGPQAEADAAFIAAAREAVPALLADLEAAEARAEKAEAAIARPLREHQAEAVMAALDAYAEGRDLGLMILRERIAQEIEAMLPTIPCPDFDRSCACSLCYETHAIRSAAAVARGQA